MLTPGAIPADIPSMTPVALDRWIRRPRRNVGFAAVYGLLAAGFLVMLVALAGELRHEGGEAWLLVIALLLAGMAVLCARLTRGWARSGLMLGEHEVVVRGPWVTRRIARSWIERFEAGLQRTPVGNPTPGVVIRLGDGSAVNVSALATESFVWSSEGKVARWEATAAALNELLGKPRN